MSDLPWLLPTAVSVGVALVVAAIVVVTVRLTRRSPRARAGARAALTAAESVLLSLDDAVEALDVEFEASDARGDAPTSARRARATVARQRDRGFVDVAELADSTAVAARRRLESARLRDRLQTALALTEKTRADLRTWTRAHRTPETLLAAAERRLAEAVQTAGDPAPLIAALGRRFDPDDWHDADASARAAAASIAEAEAALETARTSPETLDAQVRRATDATRSAARHLAAVESAHRRALQASDNVEAEVAAARAEIADARRLQSSRPAAYAADAAERLEQAEDDLERAAASAERRPRAAIEVIARVREERDALVVDAPPRRRLEAARAALPGTLACARAALAVAESRDEAGPLDDRLRRERARRQLADARTATDPEQALANARAAWHAVGDGLSR